MRRREALALGLVRYSTGKPCKRGHVCERFAVSGKCLDCCVWYLREQAKTRAATIDEATRQREREKSRRLRAARPEHYRAVHRAWCNANIEHVRDKARKRYAANRERVLAQNRKRQPAITAKNRKERAILRAVRELGLITKEDLENVFGN